MKKKILSLKAVDDKEISNDEILRFLVRESKGRPAYNIRSFKKLSDAYNFVLNSKGFSDIFIELKNNEIIQLTNNYPDNVPNVKKYYQIMGRYRDGEFGKKNLNMKQILKYAGEPKLFDDMNIAALQTLANCTSGFTRQMFLSLKKQKLKSTNINKGKSNNPLITFPANYKDISKILVSWSGINDSESFDIMFFDNIMEALEFWYNTRYNSACSDDYTNLSVEFAGIGFIEIGDGLKERIVNYEKK